MHDEGRFAHPCHAGHGGDQNRGRLLVAGGQNRVEPADFGLPAGEAENVKRKLRDSGRRPPSPCLRLGRDARLGVTGLPPQLGELLDVAAEVPHDGLDHLPARDPRRGEHVVDRGGVDARRPLWVASSALDLTHARLAGRLVQAVHPIEEHPDRSCGHLGLAYARHLSPCARGSCCQD
jgi:hypothetical protein